MAGDEHQPSGPELVPELTAAAGQEPAQAAVSLRDIPPTRWALLGLNIMLFVVCVFLMATSPLVPWYGAPNAGAAPAAATASATGPYLGPVTSTPPPAATATHTPRPTRTPRGSGGGPAPTSTPTPPLPTATATPTPLGPPTATSTPIPPTPTNTPCDFCG